MTHHFLNLTHHFLNLTFVITLILFGFGGYFLFDSISHSGPAQFPEVIGGALLLAVGLILLYSQVRLAVTWINAARAENQRNSQM